MSYTTLICLTIFLSGSSARAANAATALDAGHDYAAAISYKIADSAGGSCADNHGDSSGGGSPGAVHYGGMGGATSADTPRSEASHFYDVPRVPIGDITEIAPTNDVPSPTDAAASLAHLAKAIWRAKHGGAPVSILQYGDSHVARGVEPAAIEAAFRSIAPLHFHTMAKVGISANYPLSNRHGWLDQPIKQANPDLIIIAFGSNDSADEVDKEEYRKTYEQLIVSTKERAPHASIVMVGPADGDSISGANKGHTLPGLDTVVAVQRQLAAKNGLDFFDLRQSMGGPGSIEDWNARALAGADKLHFTTQGYEIIGKSIVQHIDNEIQHISEGH